MPDAVQPAAGTTKPLPTTPKPFAPEDEAALREALKRCSPSTFEAAVQFRKTGNPEHLPAVAIMRSGSWRWITKPAPKYASCASVNLAVTRYPSPQTIQPRCILLRDKWQLLYPLVPIATSHRHERPAA